MSAICVCVCVCVCVCTCITYIGHKMLLNQQSQREALTRENNHRSRKKERKIWGNYFRWWGERSRKQGERERERVIGQTQPHSFTLIQAQTRGS